MPAALLPLSLDDALTLRHVLASRINALGTIRLSDPAKADLARIRSMLSSVDQIIARVGS